MVPNNLTSSKLLLHPLAADGGGDFYHSGGKHWNSFLDPEWQTLAKTIGSPDLLDAKFATAPLRRENHAVLDERIAAWTTEVIEDWRPGICGRNRHSYSTRRPVVSSTIGW